jgi:hypothetical protein
MSSPRRALSWSIALLLSFTAATAVAEPSAPALELMEQAVCASVDASEPPSDASASLVCMSVRCSSEQDCWNACPGAQSVSCTRNACSYQLPGGGGGGGPTCPATRCIEDMDCECRGVPGVCVNRACRF